jgi:hypothetical protein
VGNEATTVPLFSFQRTTRRYISEDSTLHNNCFDSLKSYIVFSLCLKICYQLIVIFFFSSIHLWEGYKWVMNSVWLLEANDLWIQKVIILLSALLLCLVWAGMRVVSLVFLTLRNPRRQQELPGTASVQYICREASRLDPT